VFAHLPLIVSANGIEMSKRLGTMSIASMRDEMEVEPMAINALLAKLGTSDPIAPRLTLAELVSECDLGKISHSTPKFDLEELKSINAKILHLTPFESVRDRLTKMGLADIDEDFWNAARANIVVLSDIRQWWKVVHGAITPVVTDAEFLKTAAAALPATPWDGNTWHAWTGALKTATGRKGKELFMPLRLALTGYDHGPEMKFLLPIIGEARARNLLEGKAA
jgi:glutamyl-tRNA synthetase